MTDDMATLARRFQAYEAQVRTYGRTWFEQDASAAAVIARDPEVRATVSRILARKASVGTDTVYECGTRWLPERLDFHHRVIAQLFDSYPNEALSQGPPGGDILLQAVILLGMPGAGKTSMLRPIAHELIRRTAPRPHLVVDADLVRACLPEYKDGLGSEVVQAETALLAYSSIVETAYAKRANLILDTVGDPHRSVLEAQYLARAGWSVWCLCARVDVDLAIERAQRRALESGRYVPLAYLRSVGDRPIRAYEMLTKSSVPLAGGVLVDTNVAAGSPPTVMQTTDEQTFGLVGEPIAIWQAAEGSGCAGEES